MSNMVRGIVTIEIGGKNFTCRLGVNEWCSLEDELNLSTEEIQAKLRDDTQSGKTSFKLLRSVFRAAALPFHPDLSTANAGDLMNEVGVIEAVHLIGKIMVASMPESKATGGEKQDAPGKLESPPAS